MKDFQSTFKSLALAALVLCIAGPAVAQDETSTEITGYYQQYRNFSFDAGGGVAFDDTKLTGGGFTLAQTLAPWFAVWTQVSIYGSAEGPTTPLGESLLNVRIINNLYGVRYQTQEYGPLRFYGKAGLGFSNFGFNSPNGNFGSTKFSVGYGGGAQVWMHRNFGLTLDVSHITMSLPNLFPGADIVPGREGWDSGLTYTGGVSVRF